MAKILDEEHFDEKDLQDGEELGNFEPVEEEVETDMEADTQTPESEDDLPEKYRGKTPSEIARMHQEAEKLLGRQSSEVGELRRLVDDFVKAQLETKTTQQAEPEEEVDWYSDPDKAVQRAIDNHPKLKQAEQMSQQMHKVQALATLKAQHPDYLNILQDTDFQEWVKGSSVRMRLFQQADKNYDMESANELLSTWKERKQYTQQAVNNDKVDRKRKVQSASTGSSGGSAEPASRKIYRRADIIKLMQTDPERYMELADDIAKAYAEKRVR